MTLMPLINRRMLFIIRMTNFARHLCPTIFGSFLSRPLSGHSHLNGEHWNGIDDIRNYARRTLKIHTAISEIETRHPHWTCLDGKDPRTILCNFKLEMPIMVQIKLCLLRRTFDSGWATLSINEKTKRTIHASCRLERFETIEGGVPIGK